MWPRSLRASGWWDLPSSWTQRGYSLLKPGEFCFRGDFEHRHFLKHLDNSASRKPYPGVTQEGLQTWCHAPCRGKAPVPKSIVWANAGRAVVAPCSDGLGPSPETPEPSLWAWAALWCEPEHREVFTSQVWCTNVDTSWSQQASPLLLRWRNLTISINSRVQTLFFSFFL